MNVPMRLIDANSAADYLRESGHLAPDDKVQVTELTGGVSNVVLLVQPDTRPAFVLKQARGQLRVAQPWFCSVERIWRETAVLRICHQVLGRAAAAGPQSTAVTTPRWLFSDQDHYLFGMSAAPPHQVWKQHLLAGQIDPAIARACGDGLGQLHAGTCNDAEVARAVGDRTYFNELRLEPYYRHVAVAHPPLRTALEGLIDSVADHCLSLVHGDFSPKNLLVFDGHLMLVDFEVGHYGDPAFDLGFFLSHLVLKSLAARADDSPAAPALLALTQEFWLAYQPWMDRCLAQDQYADLVRRAIQHFAGCALARVDGKSPVDYLRPATQELVRRITSDLLSADIATWDQVLTRLR